MSKARKCNELNLVNRNAQRNRKHKETDEYVTNEVTRHIRKKLDKIEISSVPGEKSVQGNDYKYSPKSGEE